MKKEIQIISSDGCSRCIVVKTQLQNHGIGFSEVKLSDLSTGVSSVIIEDANKKGIMNLPILIVNGIVTPLAEVLTYEN